MPGGRRKFLPLVAAFILDRTHADELQQTFADSATLAVCNSEHGLQAQLQSLPVDMLVGCLAYPDGQSTLPLLRTVHARLPLLPIVAYAELNAPSMAHVLAAGQAGIQNVLIHGVRYSSRDVASLLRDAQTHTLLGYVAPTLSRVRSEYVRRYIQHCLTHAAEPITVTNVANAIGATRQHIAREFRASGLRDPSWFLRMSRVLLAAKLLSARGQSVEHIARILRFPTSTALRQALRRYTGMTASELRECDGFARTLTCVCEALTSPTASSSGRWDRHPPTDVPFVNASVPSVNGGRVTAIV